MQARMYLPAYGKFASPDPAYDHSEDGLNLYSYCSNNPVTRTDPTGMREVDEGGKGYMPYQCLIDTGMDIELWAAQVWNAQARGMAPTANDLRFLNPWLDTRTAVLIALRAGWKPAVPYGSGGNQVGAAGGGSTRPSGLTELAPGQDTNIDRREAWQGYSTYQDAVVHLSCEIYLKYGPNGTNDLERREFGTLIYNKAGKFYYAPIMRGPLSRKTDAYMTVNTDAARKYVGEGGSIAFDYHTHPTINWQTGIRDLGPFGPSGGDFSKAFSDNRPGILWGFGQRNALMYNTNDLYQQLPSERINIW
jgi:hypothetical protein